MLNLSINLFEIEAHNQKTRKFLVGNQTLQSKTKQSKLTPHQCLQHECYTYKCFCDAMQRLNCGSYNLVDVAR